MREHARNKRELLLAAAESSETPNSNVSVLTHAPKHPQNTTHGSPITGMGNSNKPNKPSSKPHKREKREGGLGLVLRVWGGRHNWHNCCRFNIRIWIQNSEFAYYAFFGLFLFIYLSASPTKKIQRKANETTLWFKAGSKAQSRAIVGERMPSGLEAFPPPAIVLCSFFPPFNFLRILDSFCFWIGSPIGPWAGCGEGRPGNRQSEGGTATSLIGPPNNI